MNRTPGKSTNNRQTEIATNTRYRVLVADDQLDVLKTLKLLLQGEGFDVETANSPQAALEVARRQHFDLALIDLNYTRDTTSGQEGLELLAALRQIDQDAPVVVMTAWSTVAVAVNAMHEGASDFIEKPWKNQRLLSILKNQARLGSALKEQKRLRASRRQQFEDEREPLIAESLAMQQVLNIAERVSMADANLLITGDNGTGKSLIARQVHHQSGRRDGPFVTVNMGALAAGVFESEMFGHVKGAFTDAGATHMGRIEMAEGGTLFLDEIGNLPIGQQAKLLQVLETDCFEPVGASRSRKANVRLIAATNADLRKQVSSGEFRKDLFFRLNTVEIHIPPLHQRPEDVTPLAHLFLQQFSRKYTRSELDFSKSALSELLTYSWPGNVRELSHVVERAVLMAAGDEIQCPDLNLQNTQDNPLHDSLPLMTLDSAEESLVRSAMERFDGNVVKSAKALGLSRSALYRRLEKYDLERNP